MRLSAVCDNIISRRIVSEEIMPKQKSGEACPRLSCLGLSGDYIQVDFIVDLAIFISLLDAI